MFMNFELVSQDVSIKTINEIYKSFSLFIFLKAGR